MGMAEKLYDAYVICADSKDDQQFVRTMIDTLESTKYNLRLYVRSRDGSGKAFDPVKEAEIISKRCKKFIVIVSEKLEENEEAMYALKLAVNQSPCGRKQHIIPLLRQAKCPLPSCINFLTVCDFTKKDLIPWFWPRVVACLKQREDHEIPRQRIKTKLPDLILDSAR